MWLLESFFNEEILGLKLQTVIHTRLHTSGLISVLLDFDFGLCSSTSIYKLVTKIQTTYPGIGLPPPSPRDTLAGIQHARQGIFLVVGDGQIIVAFHLDPAPGVRAPERLQGWLPLVGTLIALGAIRMGGYGPELRTCDVVGESSALSGGPVGCARLEERRKVRCVLLALHPVFSCL